MLGIVWQTNQIRANSTHLLTEDSGDTVVIISLIMALTFAVIVTIIFCVVTTTPSTLERPRSDTSASSLDELDETNL